MSPLPRAGPVAPGPGDKLVGYLTMRGGPDGLRGVHGRPRPGVRALPATLLVAAARQARGGLLVVVEAREVGRATQGVRLIRLRGEDDIASVTKVVADEEEETTAAVVVEAGAENAESPAGPTAETGTEASPEVTE